MQKYTYHETKDFKFEGEFTNECETCGKVHTVFTQEDRSPEYYTSVLIACDCGALVKFELPVN